jgi:hypothetical protein
VAINTFVLGGNRRCSNSPQFTGDIELVEMGAHYSRKIWHRRTWGQHP